MRQRSSSRSLRPGSVYAILSQVVESRVRGIGIAEALLGIFILLIGVVFVMELLINGERIGAQAANVTRAGEFGERVIQEIREWARTPANFDSDWSTYQGQTVTDSSGMSALVECNPGGKVLYSPNTSLESTRTDARRLGRSVVPVEVRVSWGRHDLVLHTLIAAPKKEWSAVAVALIGGSMPLGQDLEAEFAAQLLDADGAAIPDVTFYWRQNPLTGRGTMLVNNAPRDGTRMGLHHLVTLVPAQGALPPIQEFAAGETNMEAEARYFGQLIEGSLDVPLQ